MGGTVVFLGFRPKDSLVMHWEYAWGHKTSDGYYFKFPPNANVIDVAMLGAKIKRQPEKPREYVGMNPEYVDDPQTPYFDS
jgi:hypothetical protein